MVRVSQLGSLQGNLASDILNIVSGVTGVAANAVGGQSQPTAGQPTAEQLAAQRAAAVAAAEAKAKADADRKTWTYVAVGAGVLLVGGLVFITAKKRQ